MIEQDADQREVNLPEPNTKRIGQVCAFGSSGQRLLVRCEEWEPSFGDMFSIEGCHSVNPVTGESTGFDVQVTISGIPMRGIPLGNGHGAAFQIWPAIIDNGPFQNVASLPVDGAVLYQPAGARLRAIQEWWMRNNA